MLKKEKKLTLEQLIEKVDAAKKANPLDLSSDQDLSIALMNLVSLEEHFFFSGAKTGKTGFYDLINTVREMRKELMMRIVKSNNAQDGEVWCISKHLLAASMRLKEVGDKANAQGKKKDAQDLYAKAYDLYSLFWGLNMDLIDVGDVKENPDLTIGLRDYIGSSCNAGNVINETSKNSASVPANKSTVKRLGEWVKKKVNCCIE